MRRWVCAALAGLAMACGGGHAAPDAPPPPGPRCDPSLPFAAPALVAGINSDLDDATARLSEDELDVTFARLDSGVWDLWHATRTSIDDPFGAPQLLTSVNSVSSDVWPTQSPDRLTLLFDADRTTPGVFHVWRSTRASATAPFGPPQLRPELMDSDIEPMLANDHALYFSSTVRGGLGMNEIFRATVDPATGMIGTPVALVGGVNTPDAELAPAVTSDERAIYFQRVVGTEADVYTASRSTATDGFGTSAPVPGLDVAGVSEAPSWISPDGCHLYFHSDAPSGGPLGANVWMTSRPPPAP
jgi:hypothetical protein